MTATDVSRGFSAALDAVADGTEIRILRAGHPVARLVPETSRSTVASLTALLADLPPLDDDFADRVDDALAHVDMTARDPWAAS